MSVIAIAIAALSGVDVDGFVWSISSRRSASLMRTTRISRQELWVLISGLHEDCNNNISHRYLDVDVAL